LRQTRDEIVCLQIGPGRGKSFKPKVTWPDP
jgi:hypothetical protein